ncbi:MAG: hypothetical protein EAZ57_05645 [Cytophagales bacterium]|nr:MAG: hypothetical protein EAZ67_06550 [Cytophagales bacterium]TAF60837.1 MAG: hypothetical protein EAZ57_05645 [Cytophagales bacterium]
MKKTFLCIIFSCFCFLAHAQSFSAAALDVKTDEVLVSTLQSAQKQYAKLKNGSFERSKAALVSLAPQYQSRLEAIALLMASIDAENFHKNEQDIRHAYSAMSAIVFLTYARETSNGLPIPQSGVDAVVSAVERVYPTRLALTEQILEKMNPLMDLDAAKENDGVQDR